MKLQRRKLGVDHIEVVNAVRLGQRKNNSSGSRLLQVQISSESGVSKTWVIVLLETLKGSSY